MPDARGRRTPEEMRQSMEIAKKMMERSKEKELDRDLRWARGIILFIAIISIGFATYQHFVNYTSNITFAIDGCVGLLILGMYFWSRHKPYEAIITTLFIYIGVWVFSALIDPYYIIKGIIFKIVIIGGLITGLKAARKFKNRPIESEEILDDLV